MSEQQSPADQPASLPAGAGARVSAVVPTYRRRQALLDALPHHLAIDGIAEVVVVDDGSDDATAEAVAELGLSRVRVVRHPQNRGLPAARNTGAAACTTEWVVFLEDDCVFPTDYASTLLDVAMRTGADVVGAPWVSTEENVAARTAHLRPVGTVSLTSPPWTFPQTDLETPFLPAVSLVRRSVFDRLRYDEGYRGNFYREETDFYVSARRAGFKVVLTPRTASQQLGRYAGGCKGSSRVRYDMWAVRNTWRLLRKHGRWLRSQDLLDRPAVLVVLAFAASRASYYVRRPLRAPSWVWRRCRRLLGSR